MQEKKSSFSSKLGFVLAAAGSAVGLGNLWRFPYLAAQYGGGIFLLVYLILAVTFGFTLMVTEIALGRKTGKGFYEYTPDGKMIIRSQEEYEQIELLRDQLRQITVPEWQ